MSVELKNSLSIAMCSEPHLILSIDVQLICSVKSSVRFMDLHAWWLQSIHASCHQFQYLVHLSNKFFQLFYVQCRVFSYCWNIADFQLLWKCMQTSITSAGYRVGPSDFHCRRKRYLYQRMVCFSVLLYHSYTVVNTIVCYNNKYFSW